MSIFSNIDLDSVTQVANVRSKYLIILVGYIWFETFEVARMTVNKLISNDLFKIESKNK